MTAQAAERLLHKGQDMTLCCNPLEPYLNSGCIFQPIVDDLGGCT